MSVKWSHDALLVFYPFSLQGMQYLERVGFFRERIQHILFTVKTPCKAFE